MITDSISNKTVLIAPLDWGIGHATRCVPLIEHLKKNNTIIIGVTPQNRSFFQTLFPQFILVELPAYNMHYHRSLPVWLWVLKQKRRLELVIKKEHAAIQKLVNTHKINVIISDNRFGCHHPEVRSIYLTHQLFVKSPVFNWVAQRINRNYILKFNEVWVPDFEEENKSLSGKLSHGKLFHTNVHYIGPLSRIHQIPAVRKEFDYLLILSGPEPQQTLFKEAIIKRFASFTEKKIAIVQTNVEDMLQGNIHFFNGVLPEKLAECISKSETIICRSGYSTLMDLFAFLPKKIILIPTPGQPEQEYLSDYWKEKFGHTVIEQKEIAFTNFD
jgi:uncharacterized protein (TIGR00661 family)